MNKMRRSSTRTSTSFFVQSTDSPREERTSNNIEVCVRMRPILEPYEDEIVWEVDEATKTIKAKAENLDVKSLNLSHPKFYNEFSNTQKFTFGKSDKPHSYLYKSSQITSRVLIVRPKTSTTSSSRRLWILSSRATMVLFSCMDRLLLEKLSPCSVLKKIPVSYHTRLELYSWESQRYLCPV